MSEKKQQEKEYGLRDTDFYDLDEIKSRIEKRNAEKEAKKKRAKRRAITSLVLIVLIVGSIIFSFSKFFDVDHIAVEGCNRFSEEEIVNMSHATPGKNLIYKPGKAEIIDYLEQNPYIKHAEVHRRLPSTLVIVVEERAEIGALTYDNDYLIFDDEGLLLRRTQTEPKTTIVEGLVVKKIELGETLGVKDAELMKQTLNLLTAARDNDLYFVSMDMSEMYIRANVLEHLVCKGAYEQLKNGIEKGRLHTILQKLFDDGIKRGTITFSGEEYASFEPSV